MKQFCPKGHNTFITGRSINSTCITCNVLWHKLNPELSKQFRDKWVIANPEKAKMAATRWRENNLERHRLMHKKWRINHRKERAAYLRDWYKNNPGKNNFFHAKRRAARIERTPNFGQEGIEEFYRNRPEGYEVDHIIPLQARMASGLHVIWNLQYLTKSENSSKQNRFEPMEVTNSLRIGCAA